MTRILLPTFHMLGLFLACVHCCFKRRCWNGINRKEIIHQVNIHGIGSIPLIGLSTAFAGLIVIQEMNWHMQRSLHSSDMVPALTTQFIIRELATAVCSLLLVSKVGASITAEIGSMKVTDQIDAIRLFGGSPTELLLFPRFFAALLYGTCLNFLAVLMTLGTAMLISFLDLGGELKDYAASVASLCTLNEASFLLAKCLLYSGMIPIIAYTFGSQCRRGAQGVGRATTLTAVTATMSITILDFCLVVLYQWSESS